MAMHAAITLEGCQKGRPCMQLSRQQWDFSQLQPRDALESGVSARLW